MTGTVPEAVAGYFAAKNARDVAGMLGWFAADAVVVDEGRRYRGTAAIGAWLAETTRKYAVSAQVTGVAAEGARLVVTALVSGNFPGSPVSLRYRFTLAEGRIAGLEVGA